MYKAISFYLDRQPMLLNDLLSAMSARVDHSRVIKILETADNLPLARQWLISCQSRNLRSVNQALFSLVSLMELT